MTRNHGMDPRVEPEGDGCEKLLTNFTPEGDDGKRCQNTGLEPEEGVNCSCCHPRTSVSADPWIHSVIG